MKTFNKILTMFFVMGLVILSSSFAITKDAITITSEPGNNAVVLAGNRIMIEVTADNYLESVKIHYKDGSIKEIYNVKEMTKKTKSITYYVEAPMQNIDTSLEIVVRDEMNNEVREKFNYTIKYKDLTAPRVTVSEKNESTLPALTKINLNILDDESKITKVMYNWCGRERNFTDAKNEYDITGITMGKVPGKYVLRVVAINSQGLKTDETYNFYIKSEDKPEPKPEPQIDTEAPTIIATIPNNSLVNSEDRVDIIVEDEHEIRIVKCVYDDKTEQILYDNSTSGEHNRKETITMPKFGKNKDKIKLYITAEDVYGNKSNATFNYRIKYEDTTAPEISTNIASGSVLNKNLILNIKVVDNESKITTLKYNWQGSPVNDVIPSQGKPANEYLIKDVTKGIKYGKYILNVTAVNEYGRENSKTFTYYIKDEEKPTVSVNPNGGKVEPLTNVTIIGRDNEELNKITYNWDNGNSIIKNVYGKVSTVYTEVPEELGRHILYVLVEDEAGNKIDDKIEYIVVDTKKPTVSVNPNGGNVDPLTNIRITGKDNEGLKNITYNWDNGKSVSKAAIGKEYFIDIKAPEKAGKYMLNVVVEDTEGNKANKEVEFIVNELKDTEKPTVVVKPNGGKVKPAEKVTIIGKDNEELKKITYNWDDSTPIVKNVGGKEASVDTEVPTKPGKHYLYVTVEDEDGNKVEEKIEFDVVDDEKPTITVSPKDGSTVYGGKVIEATLKDNEELKKVTYNWDGDSKETKTLYGTSKTIDLPRLPYKEGTYKVTITVEDNAGNETTGRYTYYVKEEDRGKDPTVDADPDGGKVEYGDKILVTAEDEDGEIEYVEFYWDDDDDDTTKKYDDRFTVKVPSEEGKHYLYVRARDDDDNLCDYERFTYYVEENNYPGNSDIIGDLNPRVKDVRVEIRNADDKIRFEPDEDILYYVDYYNGTSSKVYNAKVVVDLPTYLDAEKASDNGRISSKQVTWSLGTLDPKEYGRLSFVARYTSSKYNEKIITVPAKIYSGSSLKDTSTVRNMIFCEGASGTGSHSAYCIGYPDGNFRPEGLITRAELATMICNIEGIRGTHRGQFVDANNHWAANNMQAIADRGYMKPRTYNRFGAEEFATRADLAYALASILDVEDLEPIFISARDTRNSEARCAIEQLLRLGIMDGYSDGTAKPNKNITRAEAVTTINNYLFRGELYTKGYNFGYNFENNYVNGGSNYILKFKDLSPSHWAYGHIMEATNHHRYERVMDGNENML